MFAGIIRLRGAGATSSYSRKNSTKIERNPAHSCDSLTGCRTGTIAGTANCPGMNSTESEGLGLSLLIYAAAIAGGLALIATPVYLANSSQVYDNPPVARANPLLNGPIVGARAAERTPLAVLKHRILVDPKIVASLNSKAQKSKPRAVAQRAAPRSRGTAVAEVRENPRQPTFFLFKLFGG